MYSMFEARTDGTRPVVKEIGSSFAISTFWYKLAICLVSGPI